MSLLRQVRCRKCKGWFGRHAPLALHGDGKTDDTAALQHLIDTTGRVPIGTWTVRSRLVTEAKP